MAKKPRTPDEAYAEALRRIEDCRAERGTYLNLSILRLSSLPPEIGQLTALTTLCLGNNQLSALPLELGRLPPTMTLFLHGNPGLQIPESVLGVILAAWDMRAETAPKSGPILDYYFRTRQPAE